LQPSAPIRGRLAYRVPLDVAVTLVSRPCWGRENLYDEPADSRAFKPVTEAMLALRRDLGPARLTWLDTCRVR
jgi:hypothetical protein